MKYIKEVEVNKIEDSKNFNVNKIQTEMLIKIPFKTPTVNTMYATFNGNRVKSKEANQLSKEVGDIVLNTPTIIIEGKLKVSIEIHSNWYNKDGTIKKRDIANLEKFITDSIFNHLEDMDDKQIFKLVMNKVQSDKEYALIKIEVYNEEMPCLSIE